MPELINPRCLPPAHDTVQCLRFPGPSPKGAGWGLAEPRSLWMTTSGGRIGENTNKKAGECHHLPLDNSPV